MSTFSTTYGGKINDPVSVTVTCIKRGNNSYVTTEFSARGTKFRTKLSYTEDEAGILAKAVISRTKKANWPASNKHGEFMWKALEVDGTTGHDLWA